MLDGVPVYNEEEEVMMSAERTRVIRIGNDDFITLKNFKRSYGADTYPETLRNIFRDMELQNEKKQPKFRF